ncbi:hypothetical protein YC2023_107675 [Brassica napus]
MRYVPSEMLSFMEGSEVEISYRNKGFENVWCKVIIEANPKSRLRQRERCVRLLKDDRFQRSMYKLASLSRASVGGMCRGVSPYTSASGASDWNDV